MAGENNIGPEARPLEAANYLREGERRTVTVLFADMKGFTALSERSDPEEMDALMTRVFSRFESVILSRGGSVEKYIGDALVAVFGYPEIHEDDPARAVEAALDFYAALERGLSEKAEVGEGAIRPQFRSGIHTGLVATGRRGRFDVVTGHTMAIAARLQSAAPPDGILISEATREKCEGRFVFSEAEELALKGKEESVAAFRVLGRKRRNLVFEGPFIGREAEVESLVAAYVQGFRAEGGGRYVSGDGGIGKTRLCAEFLARLKRFPNWEPTVLVLNPAQAGEYDYAALSIALAERLGLETGASAQEFAASAIARLGLDAGTAQVAAETLSRGGKRNRDAEGKGRECRDGREGCEIGEALTRLVDAILSSDGDMYPDIILIDNARALDAKTKAFFRIFLAEGKNRPFFLLADRSVDEGLAALFRVEVLEPLAPLSDADATRLARALDPEGADDRNVELVVKRAQGYPLFIEEYVKLLRRDRGVESVPDTIQNTILASLDRLEPLLKAFLQKLSVFRYPFDEESASELQASTEQDSSIDVGTALAKLESEGLLVQREDGLWRFKHAIIKDAVYDSLLNHNKKILHARAAMMLKRMAPGRSCDIFWHLASGELRDEAREYLLEARPRLPLDHAPLVQDLIDHRPPGDTAAHVELLFQKYAVHYNNRAFAGVESILAEMYEIALRERSAPFLARVSHLYLTHFLMRMDLEKALYYGERAIDLYASSGNRKGAVNARYFLALCRILRGEFAAALEVIESIERGDPYGERQYAASRALWHFDRGEYRENAAWNDRLAQLDAGMGKGGSNEDRRFAEIVNSFATLDYAAYAPAASAAASASTPAVSAAASAASSPSAEPDRALAVDGFDAAPPPPDWAEAEDLAQYYACRALAAGRRGDKERSRALIAEAERIAFQAGDDMGRSGARALIAWVLRLVGRSEEARTLAEKALSDAARACNQIAYFELAVLLAELSREEGAFREAAFFLSEAASLLDRPVLKERRVLIRYRHLAAALAQTASSSTLVVAEEGTTQNAAASAAASGNAAASAEDFFADETSGNAARSSKAAVEAETASLRNYLGELGLDLDAEWEESEARRLLDEELAALRGDAQRAELLAISIYGEIRASSPGKGSV